jgi:tetratricopeptide (TPR) repeat protein
MRALLLQPTLLLLVVSLAAAAPPRDNREMQAREAFAAGRYQDALDVYVKLYAEKLHPNFLRNIGRCYQNLGEPDKAISSFREYLRKAKGLPADERTEIEGYIKEMEELKQKRAAAPVEPRPDPVQPAVTPPVTSPAVHEPPTTLLTPLPPAPDESPPVYKRWWFWTAIGAAVVAGVAVAIVASSGSKDPACPAGFVCLR